MTPKQLTERKERIKKLNAAMAKLYPDAHTELNFKTPWQFLVAVELSAQCTDKRVNIITKDLFKKYKSLDDYAKADYGEFEKMIHSCTYSHNKAKNILAAARMIKERLHGKIPKTIKELIEIPGVGRLSNRFEKIGKIGIEVTAIGRSFLRIDVQPDFHLANFDFDCVRKRTQDHHAALYGVSDFFLSIQSEQYFS